MVKILFWTTLVFFTTLARVNGQGTAVTMTDALRQIVLNAHNTLRSTVALGNAVNKNGTTLPKAADMYKLSYSKMVEGYAQSLANSCKFQHNYVNGTSNNLWATGSTGGYAAANSALNSSVYSWYSELKTDGQNSLTMDGTNYNHFTQVVWAKTKEIGCAVANCPDLDGNADPYQWTYVVCDYSPAGNVRTWNIYTASSTSANACPSGSTANTATGLCQINNVADIHA